MAIRCPACRGTKKVIGLGSMIKDCLSCRGVGFVSEPAVVASVADKIAGAVVASDAKVKTKNAVNDKES